MGVAVNFDFFQPVLYMVKCVFASDVVHQQGSDCTSIIGSSDRSKILLACSIPYLKFYVFTADLNRLGSELHSNSYVVCTASFILDELKDNTGFAHSCVSNNYELE